VLDLCSDEELEVIGVVDRESSSSQHINHPII
jgi:hypothetical protein